MQRLMKIGFIIFLGTVVGCQKSSNSPKNKISSAETISKDSLNSDSIRLKKSEIPIVTDTAIIRTFDAEELPISFHDTFDAKNQKLIVKIKNFHKSSLSAQIEPQDKLLNIRFNQIRKANGDFDGPFGREIKDYQISKSGEIWLIIAKNLMASGSDEGSFRVEIQ